MSIQHLPPTIDDPEYDDLVERIKAFRDTVPHHVQIVAVTKYSEAWKIRAAYAAGIRDFGENRILDAAQKQVLLQDLADVTWHFIGRLQSNKALKAIQIFDWIQSIDSLALAQRVDRLIREQPARSNFSAQALKSCLQVKLLPDENKSGWAEEELLRHLPQLLTLENLNIQGLMVIPPLGLTPQEAEHYFQRANTLATQLTQEGFNMPVRSMGMSDDYQIAIGQGSTLIRPGRILFGDRAVKLQTISSFPVET